MLINRYRTEQLKRIYNFALNLKRAYHVFNQHIGVESRLDEIRKEFNQFDFDDGRGRTYMLGDALTDVGTAIRLMRYYKIELYPGTSYSDCRAILDKENWKHPINGPLIGRVLAYENPNEVNEIYGFGRTANEAISNCLICAKTAKVI